VSVLIIDNYDSFTWNLVHLVEQFTDEFEVRRNDEIEIPEAGRFDKLLFSPGPGMPEEAGVMQYLICEYAKTKSMLGVCLGMQGLVECFGGALFNMKAVRHGIKMQVRVKELACPLFKDVPPEFEAGHYHSWAIERETLPSELMVTAEDTNGLVMAVAHRTLPLFGVQFHPESIMTEHGRTMIGNWLGD